MDWWKDLIQKLNKFSPKQWLRPAADEDIALPEAVEENASVKMLHRRVRLQALTALVSIVLLLVLVFAMTAAWYTNVAKTSDLTFQTEAWGFDAEKIKLSEEVIAVAPGGSGVVPIEVDNSDNTEGVKIGVTISKSGDAVNTPADELATLEEMRKRIYFYVDVARTYTFADEETAVVDGETESDEKQETVSRVYLGATDAESYTYEILPGEKLTLTEDYYNNVPIKWMWVYDMLGYYFRGTVSNDTVFVDEYIRPIEYDYSYAVFDETMAVNADGTESRGENYGQLISTGDLSRAELLQKISAADGYEGMIPVKPDGEAIANKVKGADGVERLYYPVDVDIESGVGVWAYLCSKDEIEAGIAFDNALNEEEVGASLTARIVFTAVNLTATGREVDSAATLEAALRDDEIAIVSLRNDVDLPRSVEMTGKNTKVIDLNGYALNSRSGDTVFSVTDGARLTVMNGSLNAQTATTAFTTDGANLVLSGLTATGFDRIVDNAESAGAADAAPSTIRITDCDFTTSDVSFMIRGSGLDADSTTKLIVEDSRIVSDYVAISGNGNASNAGTEIVIFNSTLEGLYGALYQPQQRAAAIIKESTLSGYTGIIIKGGTATIINSVISGTGNYNAAANALSGFTDTGDGVYVEAGYDWSASVIIKGKDTVITSKNAYAVELFGMENKGPGKILVYDGTLKVLQGAKGSLMWNGIGTLELYGESLAGEQEITYELPVSENTQ